ncbi:MAG: ABC transporter permease [Chitinophagaceae bacterium]
MTEDLGNGVITFTDEKTGELKAVREENICYADADFLNVFSFPLVAGTPSLELPKTMAMSASMANKLFGKTNVAGRSIQLSNQFGNTDYRITAIFKDITEQSDLKPSILLSLHTLQSAAARNDNDWADPGTTENNFTNCYLVLKKGVNARAISQQITGLIHAAQPATAGNTTYYNRSGTCTWHPVSITLFKLMAA